MKFPILLSLLIPLVSASWDSSYWWTISTKNASIPTPRELTDTENNQFLFWQDDGSVYISRANREIARNGGMFQSTVFNHMSAVYNKSDLNSTISFHPGPLNRQLSLQIKRGDKGLMTLVTLTGPTWNDGPTKDSFPADMPTEWSVFQIGPGWGGGALLVKDGQDVPTRQWIKYRNGGFDRVGLWDGITPQSRPFDNITLVVTSV